MIFKKILFSFTLSIISLSLFSQNLDSIINKHLDAIGGIEEWKKVKAIEFEMEIADESNSIQSVISIDNYKRFKNQLKFNSRVQSLQKNDSLNKKYFILIADNLQQKFLPDNVTNKPVALSATEREMYLHEMTIFNLFTNYKTNEISVKLYPNETIQDVEYYKLHCIFKNGREEFVYINSTTYLISKRILLNSEVEETYDFLEYQKLKNGLLFPKKYISFKGEHFVKSIKINPTFTKDFFTK